jgi:hypothetical protein
MRELLIKIRSLFEGKGEIDAATKSVADLGTETEKTSTITGGMAGKIGGWLAGLATFTAALSVAGRAMREFAAKQEGVAKLDQALRNSGQATRAYREELQALAGQLQRTTAIGDEVWYGIFETLTKFGSTKETIVEHTEAVKNLAGATGMDVQSAAMLFARAMTGNTQMLSRYGIQVDNSLGKTEMLNQLMEQLAQRGAGILEAKAQTLNGQLQNLQNNIGDLLAAFGQMGSEAGVLGGALDNINNVVLKYWIDRFSAAIPPVSDLTNNLQQQGRTAEEVAESQAKLSAALDEMAKAQAAADKATESQIRGLEKQKRATEEIAKAERDLAIEKVRNSDATEEDKAAQIAEINRAFRQEEVSAEQAHQQELARIRREAATKAGDELAAARAEAAKKAAEAEAAEIASGDEAGRMAQARELEGHLNNLIRQREAALAKASNLGGFFGMGRDTEEFQATQDEIKNTTTAIAALRSKVAELSTDGGALKLAEEARAAAEAADATTKALEERHAALVALAAETEQTAAEEIATLTEKKRLEQEIADEKHRGELARLKETEAARLARLEAERERLARQGSAKAAADTRSELQKMFDAQRAFDQLSNSEKRQVQKDMQREHGLAPRNEDGSSFTAAQHYAGETPFDITKEKRMPGMPPAAPPAADPNAPLTAASDQLADSSTNIATSAGALEKSASTLAETSSEIGTAAKSIESAAQNLKASLAELRSRISSLESAAS